MMEKIGGESHCQQSSRPTRAESKLAGGEHSPPAIIIFSTLPKEHLITEVTMHLLVGMFALTQAARQTWMGQADELSRQGLIGPAIFLRAYTDIVFAPVMAAQEEVVRQIAASASSFD
jgi:hypothetical protein